MIKTEAIRLANHYTEPMLITWDTGKRCNYDCSYCEASRHDNYSSFHSLTEYLDTFDFIKKYVSIYNKNKNEVPDHTNINFTGGEPTLNPNFWELADCIKQDSSDFQLSLTTNGAWNRKYTEKIKQKFEGVTVSYHTESHAKLKDLVIENILDLKNSNLRLQVNVMLHADYFDECVEVYEYLKANNISVKPRPIGDGNDTRKGWFKDQDGYFRKTTHDYSKEQIDWFFHETGLSKNSKCSAGDELGRGCCGGRCIEGLIDNDWQPISIVDTHFKDWYCSVNWYFLHIEQHTGLVYHHQTCQAKFEAEKGPIGSLSDTQKILNETENNLADKKIIVCPNNRCGCGMCAPKAKNKDVFMNLKDSI